MELIAPSQNSRGALPPKKLHSNPAVLLVGMEFARILHKSVAVILNEETRHVGFLAPSNN